MTVEVGASLPGLVGRLERSGAMQASGNGQQTRLSVGRWES